MPNRRGGLNLIFNGYLYTSERRYNSTVNWVCNKNSNLNLKCPARCVTSGEQSIKLSKKLHNHQPIYDDTTTTSSGSSIGLTMPVQQQQSTDRWYRPDEQLGVDVKLEELPNSSSSAPSSLMDAFDSWMKDA